MKGFIATWVVVESLLSIVLVIIAWSFQHNTPNAPRWLWYVFSAFCLFSIGFIAMHEARELKSMEYGTPRLRWLRKRLLLPAIILALLAMFGEWWTVIILQLKSVNNYNITHHRQIEILLFSNLIANFMIVVFMVIILPKPKKT
jgi:hypothetical protein